MIYRIKPIRKDIVVKVNNLKKLEAYKALVNIPKNHKTSIKRRLITLGITILMILLIFTFDSFIENLFGISKEKIIG